MFFYHDLFYYSRHQNDKSLKITDLRSQPHYPGANELRIETQTTNVRRIRPKQMRSHNMMCKAAAPAEQLCLGSSWICEQ